MIRKTLAALLCGVLCIAAAGCSSGADGLTAEPKGATDITAEANQSVYDQLDFDDTQEQEFAERGLIAKPDSLEITDEEGNVVWSQDDYDFLDETEEAPDTANPSLWRHTGLNHNYGLFEVADGIYQVRGYDISNITFIEGDTGWIVFDPLMTYETAAAAKAFVDQELGKRPVRAVVYSHSHADHFGGVRGIVSEEDVENGSVQIIAPDGFEEHAVSENINAGTAMNRRANYQYGRFLDKGAEGTLDVGIGLTQSVGTVTYISPTDIITLSLIHI